LRAKKWVRFSILGKCGKIGGEERKAMKRTRAQIKAEIMKRVEKEIDEMLDWREGSAPPNLSQFEEEILQARKAISQAMIEGMLSGEENQRPVEAPHCPKCGVAMENKGKRDKVVETRLGALRMQREYYVCPQCGAGFFPPG
jgi:ribosomal protein S27AE